MRSARFFGFCLMFWAGFAHAGSTATPNKCENGLSVYYALSENQVEEQRTFKIFRQELGRYYTARVKRLSFTRLQKAELEKVSKSQWQEFYQKSRGGRCVAAVKGILQGGYKKLSILLLKNGTALGSMDFRIGKKAERDKIYHAACKWSGSKSQRACREKWINENARRRKLGQSLLPYSCSWKPGGDVTENCLEECWKDCMTSSWRIYVAGLFSEPFGFLVAEELNKCLLRNGVHPRKGIKVSKKLSLSPRGHPPDRFSRPGWIFTWTLVTVSVGTLVTAAVFGAMMANTQATYDELYNSGRADVGRKLFMLQESGQRQAIFANTFLVIGLGAAVFAGAGAGVTMLLDHRLDKKSHRSVWLHSK